MAVCYTSVSLPNGTGGKTIINMLIDKDGHPLPGEQNKVVQQLEFAKVKYDETHDHRVSAGRN